MKLPRLSRSEGFFGAFSSAGGSSSFSSPLTASASFAVVSAGEVASSAADPGAAASSSSLAAGLLPKLSMRSNMDGFFCGSFAFASSWSFAAITSPWVGDRRASPCSSTLSFCSWSCMLRLRRCCSSRSDFSAAASSSSVGSFAAGAFTPYGGFPSSAEQRLPMLLYTVLRSVRVRR